MIIIKNKSLTKTPILNKESGNKTLCQQVCCGEEEVGEEEKNKSETSRGISLSFREISQRSTTTSPFTDVGLTHYPHFSIWQSFHVFWLGQSETWDEKDDERLK